MGIAVPDAVITDYDHLIDRLDLPDPDDRHVLAAAIAAEASLVTFSLADFPRSAVPPDVSVLAVTYPESLRDGIAQYEAYPLSRNALDAALSPRT